MGKKKLNPGEAQPAFRYKEWGEEKLFIFENLLSLTGRCMCDCPRPEWGGDTFYCNQAKTGIKCALLV